MYKPKLDAYLFFPGNCREAMEFYQQVFGGKVNFQKMSELPDVPPGMEDKVMHAHLVDAAVELMASDSSRTEPYGVSNISLSLSGEDEAQLRALFEKLSDGAREIKPLERASWGDLYGSLTDKFGIDWMVNIGKMGS